MNSYHILRFHLHLCRTAYILQDQFQVFIFVSGTPSISLLKICHKQIFMKWNKKWNKQFLLVWKNRDMVMSEIITVKKITTMPVFHITDRSAFGCTSIFNSYMTNIFFKHHGYKFKNKTADVALSEFIFTACYILNLTTLAILFINLWLWYFSKKFICYVKA